MIIFKTNNMETKPWWQSRTLWIAIIQAIIGVVTVLETSYPTAGFLLMAKSMVDVLLRVITSTPLK